MLRFTKNCLVEHSEKLMSITSRFNFILLRIGSICRLGYIEKVNY